MTKVSTNAGKHPYCRTDEDYVHLFDHIQINKPGLKLINIKPKFKTEVLTQFKDKRGKKIFFKDVIIYDKEEYEIDYNAKEFYWIACNIKNPAKTLKLSQIAINVLLKISYNKS